MPTLLIVEDDPAYATRLRRNLETTGFRVTHAPDVTTALECLAERTFDLVLSDILRKASRAQTALNHLLLFGHLWRNEALLHRVHST